jgi:aldehyde:ferredoxin oxidoreductase
MKPESTGRKKGYWGKICNVDLSSGTIEMEELEDEFYRKYLSGVGLGAKILWDRMKPGADPMGPDNILGFTTGILTGTSAAFSGRFTVVAKSPAYGGWGDANCGGYFSFFLKRCGIDALFFRGVSDKPVYLYIDEKGAELKDASNLWGKDALETEEELQARYPKAVQVACIGTSGEKCSYIAGISTDRGRMAARSGLGGVMGSKKLKAVVVRGSQRVGVSDKSRYKELDKGFRDRLKTGDSLKGFLSDWVTSLTGWIAGKGFYLRTPAFAWKLFLRRFGTIGILPMSAECGDLPIKNWSGDVDTDFPYRDYKRISAEAVVQYETKKYGCQSCPIRCGGEVEIKDGPHKMDPMHKPEYETVSAFGSLLLIDDVHMVFKLNDMANRAGIDTISLGGVIAFAIECYEQGILTAADTGGLALGWGNAETTVELAKMIIDREGIGDVLADGVKPASERIGKGSEKYAVHCGGVEAPMHDPKFDPTYGISYYCEPTPGRHTISAGQYLDMQFLEKKFSRAVTPPAFTFSKGRYRYSEQGEGIAIGAYFKMLVDCAGVCLFGTQVGGDMPLCEMMNAATGWDFSNDEYLVIGERIHQLRHAFNVREGLNPVKDFRPHPRIYGSPPQTEGPVEGITLDLDAQAKSSYEATHWDLETGKPALDYLRQIDLPEVIEALYPEESAGV